MYNAHRGMMPQHQVPNNRLTELLDQIRAEFDTQLGQAGRGELERENFSQIRELDVIRQKLFELEQTHLAVKNEQDRKIEHLQRELDQRSATHGGGPAQPQPPVIGHGPRDLFGQIMAGGGAQGPSALGPPPPAPDQLQGLPGHLTQGAGLNTGPQPSQHSGYGYQPGAGINGYGQQPPPPATSPGPKPRVHRGPPGPATPQPGSTVPYLGSPRSHMPTPPPGHRQPPMQQQMPIPNVGNALGELDVEVLPAQYKHVGDDWWCVFNPAVPRRIDVNLVHTLSHKSVVCCVRFSRDGRFVATGCNHSAMIYDVDSGHLIAHLEDETAEKDGDLYIRSVCFSPDGKYLATGAEDKMIRVWDIQSKEIKIHFGGHEQDIYSLDFSANGRILASGSGDKTVRLWNLDTEQCLKVLRIDDGVTTVALSPDGRFVAAGSLDRSVRVWEVDTGNPIDFLDGSEGHEDSVYSVAFSPNGRDLVSGSLDRTIKMWQLTAAPQGAGGRGAGFTKGGSGKCRRTFVGHMDFVLSVALTPDGKWVLSGSKDRGVQFWDPATGVAQLHLQGHKNSVISVAPSPQGRLFATGSGDQKARIWSYNDNYGPR